MNVKLMWENATPTMKRLVMAAVALSVFIVFGSFVAFMDRGKTRPKPVKTETDATVMMPTRKNTDMEGLASTATALQRRIQQVETDRKTDMAGLQEQLKQIREQVTGTDTANRDMADIKARLDAFSRKIDEVQNQVPKPPALPPAKLPPLDKVIPRNGNVDSAGVAGDVGLPSMETAAKPVMPEMMLRVIGPDEQKSTDGKEKGGQNNPATGDSGGKAGGESARGIADKKTGNSDYVYLPMGSMVQGVLLNGLDAPTSGAAQKSPTPVLIRVKHDAILPNRARMDVKEFFIVASGFGVMSTERAQLRTEGISCVREDGGVIETNLAGYVIGEDGKVGMRGRLVSKQGALIAKSLASGFLSGLGKALTPTGVVGLNLNPTAMAQTQSYDMGTAFEAGMLGGASNSLNQIAKFYLDIAKEMVPVVEVDAGRPVTIVLTRGGNLRLNRK